MLNRQGSFAGLAAAAAMTVVFAPSPVQAGTAAPGKVMSATSASSGATDFSAARRRYYRGGGGAAAAAAFAGIVGTGLAIAASQDRGYYGGPEYYGGPAYYGGGPYDSYGYYGGPPAYGGGGYGYRSGVPYYRGHPLADW